VILIDDTNFGVAGIVARSSRVVHLHAAPRPIFAIVSILMVGLVGFIGCTSLIINLTGSIPRAKLESPGGNLGHFYF